MSRTNSNSMTALLIATLNNEDSEFRSAMFKYFKERTGADIPSETDFYDGTHQTLLYKEMNGKEIDIIARERGKRKPVLMIEVKTGVWENLQESQCKNGEYQITAEEYEIPLVYIVPRYYAHNNEIPENAVKIEWEDVLGIARNHDKYLAALIENFVDISEDEGTFSEEERNLLISPDLLRNVYNTKKKVLEEIYSLLKKRKEVSPQEDQYGVGWYYKYGRSSFFIGFNPWQDGKRFFSLCIKEDASTDKDDKLYYEDGWYYVPVQDFDCVEGDEKVLSELRKKNFDIPDSFAKSLLAFYTLKAKIANLNIPKSEHYDEDDGIGFCIGNGNYFLGLSFVTMQLTFDIHKDIIDKEKCKDLNLDGDYYSFPLCDHPELFSEFLLSSSGEELQKNFNSLVDAAKLEADKYLKS